MKHTIVLECEVYLQYLYRLVNLRPLDLTGLVFQVRTPPLSRGCRRARLLVGHRFVCPSFWLAENTPCRIIIIIIIDNNIKFHFILSVTCIRGPDIACAANFVPVPRKAVVPTIVPKFCSWHCNSLFLENATIYCNYISCSIHLKQFDCKKISLLICYRKFSTVRHFAEGAFL
jgi:hypothetical protein